ncbi:MAG: Gfo/Idh/MocA family oxidoreductase [bacterium]|nr:Gfo/Idh/MocA family oxidoreductase [bacterium]
MSFLLSFGILGAARIAPRALIQPCLDDDRAAIVSVASRDRKRAEAFAREHSIPEVSRDYDALLEREDIDAVYNALPASLHAPWTLAALRAGKHVLCEKPFALNASQAQEMVDCAQETGRTLVEAFHYRYHPLTARLIEICRSGELGTISHIDAAFSVPIPNQADIRYQVALGGGGTMDLGCYPIHLLRSLIGEEPEVLAASAKQDPPGIDVEMEAQLRFPSGITARMYCAMLPETSRGATIKLSGSRAELEVVNPFAPHLGHRVRLSTGSRTREESVESKTTYHHQLDAFIEAVRSAEPALTSGADSIANMRVIDSIYAAAGLPARGS